MNTMRLVSLVCGLLAAAVPAHAEAAPKYYTLRAGDAAVTLRQFAEQSGEEVLFLISTVRGVRTNEVKGELTARTALERMVAGTELVVVQDTSSKALTVKRAHDPNVPRAADRAVRPARNNAPTVGTGVITGRVFNRSTGEFLRNAQIRVVETGIAAVSEDEGRFWIPGVPTGSATLVVSYTGYRSETAVVEVTAGATAAKDFELVSTLQIDATSGDGTVKLGAFVVSSEREGSAKAIMDQRKSMNLTNTVASDSFGDNAEGNIGEFLRHMPGVELDTAYGEVRNVRLRGMAPDYTSVTVDGVSLASADASPFGNARVFTFENASLNSMEAIEVSKTVSADVDANAPAGTINLKTKRAFDRAGRRVSLQANLVAHSEEFSFDRTAGPNDSGRSLKLRPGGILEYSDIFLNRRLGVVLNISESNVYQETNITNLTYNRTPTAADTRPAVITALGFQQAARFNKRFATTLTTDYKVTPSLALSLGLVYNYADLWTPQRTVTFNTGARNTVLGADPLVAFVSNSPTASVAVNPVGVAKLAETVTAVPKFFYKRGGFELVGTFAYSDATSWYDPIVRRHSVRDTNSPTATGVNFRASRASATAADWKLDQISGPDLASGASFSTPVVTVGDGRFTRSVMYSADLVATFRTSRIQPVTWKTGLKTRLENRKFENDMLARRFDYVPGGIATPAPGAWAAFASAYPHDLGSTGGSITSLTGRNVFLPDLARIAQAFADRPGDFRQNMNAANYYTAFIANRRRYEERIDAGFLMADTRLGRAQLRAGLRWEDTSTDATEFDPRSTAEVRAAGFPITAGRATTIPGLQYQFLSQPKIHRRGGFDNLFPSASVKWLFTDHLNLHLGYSSTIRRASYANLSGILSVNDDTQRVTTPNASLRPETSKNYSARLAYYFEPVGQLSVTLFQNTVRNLHLSDELTAAEFGNIDPDLANYTFITTTNSDDLVRLRAMEIEYSQALSFLPQPLKRLSVRAAYTRNYAGIIKPDLTPHSISTGLSYSLGRFSGNANYTWSDDVPTTTTGLTFRRHRSHLDAGASWRFSQALSLSVNARNLLNTPYYTMQEVAPVAPVWTGYSVTGVSWTVALKATY